MLKYRTDLDGLRALAVTPVVLYHAGIGLVSGGFIGVDIFFVISGFLISGIIRDELEARNFSMWRFYERRIRRIIPAYLAVCIAVFIASLWFLTPDDFVGMAESMISSLFFVTNMYFAGQMSYFQEASESLPLLHLWSLAVEEQFYLFWPIFLMLFIRFVDRRYRPALLIAMIVAGIAVAQWALLNKSITMVFFYSPFRYWELAMGAYLALTPPPALPNRGLKIGVGLLALALIFTPIFLYTKTWPLFPGLAALAPCLGAALVIYLGIHEKSVLTPVLGAAPLRGIGLISYSLYLWHWPLFAFFHVVTGRGPHLIEAIPLIIIAVALAYLSWRYVEGPFRKRGPDAVFAGLKPIFTFAGASFAGVAAIGMVSIFMNGFPQRAPEDFRQMQSVSLENPVYKHCLRGRDPRLVSVTIEGCNWGGGSAGRSVIWGDSHAAAYFQGMKPLAEREHERFDLFAMQSCMPLLNAGQRNATQGRAKVACSQFNEKMVKDLVRDRGISRVYLSGYWLKQALGEVGDDPNAPPPIIPGALVRLANALKDTVTPIAASGKSVVLLPDVPSFPSGGGICVNQRMFMGQPVAECGVSREYYQATAGQINRVLGSIAKSVPNVTFVDASGIFCDASRCMPTIGGTSAFIDKHHLNTRGAEAVMTLFSDGTIGQSTHVTLSRDASDLKPLPTVAEGTPL